MSGFSQGLIVGCILGCVMSATVIAIAQPVVRLPPQVANTNLRAPLQAASLTGAQAEALQAMQSTRLAARLTNGRPTQLGDMHVRIVAPAPTCTSHDCDEDGHIAAMYGGDDCNDNDPAAHPGNIEVGDVRGHDEDCDPTTIGTRDADGDGFIDAEIWNAGANGGVHGTDCDDNQKLVNPMQQEVPNERDDDCDGVVDDLSWWAPGGRPYLRSQ